MMVQSLLQMEIMIVATNFPKLLKDIGTKRDQQIALIKEGAVEHAVQIIEQFFKDLFEANPKLTHVFITGYTPEWNDGEECYHNTEVYMYNNLNPDSWNELGEFLECHMGWDVDYDEPSEELKEVNAGLSKSECRDIEDMIPVEAMSEALGTNWLIQATRDGVKYEPFSIGY